jgi:transcriptional regulator with XRE-family HTH domain
MTGQELQEARRRKGWTQQEASARLGVTQAYFSMLENGRRTFPYSLARKVAEMLDAPATTLPLREEPVGEHAGEEKLRAELAALGYPGFAHLRGRARRNPAEVLLRALNEANLDSRVVEGLPWLALTYADMDWDWAVRNAKLLDRQNRLGFVTTMAYQLATNAADEGRARKLKEYSGVLERSRLVKEDTLCHDSLTKAEKEWLRVNRPADAEYWNLLTDMKVESLPYASS